MIPRDLRDAKESLKKCIGPNTNMRLKLSCSHRVVIRPFPAGALCT